MPRLQGENALVCLQERITVTSIRPDRGADLTHMNYAWKE
jgi:hypothetical protein